MIDSIISFIEGYAYSNSELLISFFKNINKEKNFDLFLLDYKGDFDEFIVGDMDSLCNIASDLDYITLVKNKGDKNFFSILETDIVFIYESQETFKRKDVMKKSKKFQSNKSHMFNRIEVVLEENLGGDELAMSKQFFNHLENTATITDIKTFDLEFRPVSMKEEMISEDAFYDVCTELARAGIISMRNKKENSTSFNIKNTDIVFSVKNFYSSVNKKPRKKQSRSKANIIKKQKNVAKAKPTVKENPFLMTEDEINERALSVINSALKNSTEEVINIFEKISLPFNGENYKRQLFERIFDLAKLNGEWRDDIGYVLFSKKRTKKVVVSHMDLISPFNRGFARGRVYEIEDDKLVGALDNTFTNAVVINSILNNKADDTTYLFTLDEETSQYAIRDYMKLFGTEQFVINLDITNEGMKNHMAIEYDEPSWEICKQIEENMDSPFFTKDRVCDDMDEVVKANGRGFSYCIPSGKNIHSYNNYTYLKNIKPYMEGLDYLIHEMCVLECEENIKHISIKKALKCKTLKKLKKKDVKKVSKFKSSSSYNSSRNYSNADNFDRNYTDGLFAPDYTDDETAYEEDYDEEAFNTLDEIAVNKEMSQVILFIAEDTCPEEFHQFREFVSEMLLLDRFFTREEVVEVSNERTFSVLLASEFIKRVDENKYVLNKEYRDTKRFKLLTLAMTKAKNLNFVKLAKFFPDVEEKFSSLDLVSMHIDKNIDEVLKYPDIMELVYSGIQRGLIIEEDKYFYFLD